MPQLPDPPTITELAARLDALHDRNAALELELRMTREAIAGELPTPAAKRLTGKFAEIDTIVSTLYPAG